MKIAPHLVGDASSFCPPRWRATALVRWQWLAAVSSNEQVSGVMLAQDAGVMMGVRHGGTLILANIRKIPSCQVGVWDVAPH